MPIPDKTDAEAMTMKLSLDNMKLSLLEVYGFEGLSNQHKYDGMLNNFSSIIVFDCNHTYQLKY